MIDRFFQALLIVSTLAFSWLAMQAVHELGHVVHLWLSGGTVEYVVLHPLAISYTHPGENPHPLFVAAAGAIWGTALPVAVWLAVRLAAPRHAYLPQFFAGFCLIANGGYLAADAVMQGGDAMALVGGGVPPWLLISAGLPMAAAGLWMWNGLGPRFGRGESRGNVDRRAALAVTASLAVLLAAEIILSPR